MSVKQEDGKYLIDGVILTADGPNHSGKTYEIESLKKAIAEYNGRDPATRLGEINRDFTDGDDFTKPHINISKVSHRVGELILHDDGTVTTTCVVMNTTPAGKMVKDLIESDAKLGVSSRALQFEPTPVMVGKVHDDVISDLEFIRIDVIPEQAKPED